jgi:ATP-dependent RNA helicase DDX41
MVDTDSRKSDGQQGGNGDEYSLPADYKPYVPVAKRRAAQLAALGGRRGKRVRTAEEEAADVLALEREKESEKEREEREREAARRERTLLQEAQEVRRLKVIEGMSSL